MWRLRTVIQHYRITSHRYVAIFIFGHLQSFVFIHNLTNFLNVAVHVPHLINRMHTLTNPMPVCFAGLWMAFPLTSWIVIIDWESVWHQETRGSHRTCSLFRWRLCMSFWDELITLLFWSVACVLQLPFLSVCLQRQCLEGESGGCSCINWCLNQDTW